MVVLLVVARVMMPVVTALMWQVRLGEKHTAWSNKLVTIRVLDGKGLGTISGVLAGIDYLLQQKTDHPETPMVANLLLGGYFSRALNDTVEKAVTAGVEFVVAAGNSNEDFCNESPASSDSVITVAASTQYDARAQYSNFGACVEIYAPGDKITSAWLTSDRASETISGTSMASPPVAGVAALYFEKNPSWTPAQVWKAMQADAIPNAISRPGTSSPSILLNTVKLLKPSTTTTTTTTTDPSKAGGAAGKPGAGSTGGKTGADTGTGTGGPTCGRVFDTCTNKTECCTNRCTLAICWLW